MTSKFLRHIACEHCGSKDANSLYDDGHTHCFSCGVTEHEGAYDERTVMRDAVAPRKVTQMEIKGTCKSIPDPQKFRDNWDEIFGRKTEKPEEDKKHENSN